MQSDRELLELAALAAEINDLESGVFGFFRCIGEHEDGNRCLVEWNPLANDSDALRLAVKLGLIVNCPVRKDGRDCAAVGRGAVLAQEGGDPYIATRRAIVRAAAELGRNTAQGDGGGV